MMPHHCKRISVLLLTIIIIINLECIQILLQKYAEKMRENYLNTVTAIMITYSRSLNMIT